MKQPTQLLRLVLAAVLFTLVTPTLLAAPPRTGIQGRAALYISYGPPTVIEEEPGVSYAVSPGDLMMSVPASFTVLFAHSGRKVGHFSTDADGNINVLLPPGQYVIVPDTLTLGNPPFGFSLSTGSFEVTVRPKEFTYALILYYQNAPLTVFAAPTH